MFGSHRYINHIGVLPEDPQRHPQRIGGGHFVEVVDDLPDDCRRANSVERDDDADLRSYNEMLGGLSGQDSRRATQS
jgi:hypothetical protein